MRGLRLYGTRDDRRGFPSSGKRRGLADAGVQVRSRFRSIANPDRFALYSIQEVTSSEPPSVSRSLAVPQGEHTLAMVREFRRVPLQASALALTIFMAREGAAAQVIAALAHFAERAVSLYQPAYLFLAHSLEQPRLSALLTGVHERAALQAASSTAFSVELLLPELRCLLVTAPEWYAYCPDSDGDALPRYISPHAV